MWECLCSLNRTDSQAVLKHLQWKCPSHKHSRPVVASCNLCVCPLLSPSQPQWWLWRLCGDRELVESHRLSWKGVSLPCKQTWRWQCTSVVSHENPMHRRMRLPVLPALADRETQCLLEWCAAEHGDLCPATVGRPDACESSTKACVYK